MMKKSLFSIALVTCVLSGCFRLGPIGTGGRYNEGRKEVTRRGGDVDKAIVDLEEVVKQNPTYKDSLTLLGRAYYKKTQYQAAHQILQRALAVNKEDEIAWVSLGLTQLRLGMDEKGLEAIQGGITLFNKATQDIYHPYMGFKYWDRAGLVKTALRRAITAARNGLQAKDEIIRTSEALLAAIDHEEFFQRFEKSGEQKQENL